MFLHLTDSDIAQLSRIWTRNRLLNANVATLDNLNRIPGGLARTWTWIVFEVFFKYEKRPFYGCQWHKNCGIQRIIGLGGILRGKAHMTPSSLLLEEPARLRLHVSCAEYRLYDPFLSLAGGACQAATAYILCRISFMGILRLCRWSSCQYIDIVHDFIRDNSHCLSVSL